MDPQVIHLIMCDRAYHDRRNLLRLNINGLHVRIRTDQPLPVRHDFVAVVMMIGIHGSGELWLRVVRDATNRRVAESPRRRVRFPRDPDEVYGFYSRVERCMIPAYGRYRLELWLDDDVLATCPFWLLPKV
jgi:hypothetical protein